MNRPSLSALNAPSMPQKFSRASILLCLFTGLVWQARAEGFVSLQVEAVSVGAAASLTRTIAPVTLPALTGPAAGLTPVASVAHYDSIWLLARDRAGQTVWLGYSANSGWQRKAPPPVTLENDLEPGGQAHLLAIHRAGAHQIEVYTYHIITDTWAQVGQATIPGTLTGIQSAANGFVLVGRDVAGAEQHLHVSVVMAKRLLGWIDWFVIVAYLGLTAGIGFYFYVREKKPSNEEFFLAGRNVPWWAAGVSLYATGTSAISYIATPAKSFAENWQYLAANVVGIGGTAFVAICIVPLLRRLNLMSVYHYLEMRFHPNVRTLGSAMAIVLQLGGRMSIVLFLPSLAMSAVTGLSVTSSILIMGGVTIVYTVLGGMKAVIWTDFIQVFVMLGGAFVALGYVVSHIGGGVAGFFRTALAAHKFRTFDWDFTLTQPTVWGFLFVSILGIMTIPQDQVMMQRVLATRSDREAGWSMWTLAAIVVPGNLTFFGIGTALYVYYKHFPGHLNPMLSVDSTFPQFIAAELPVGVTGLIIAGIFAASMSTLSSCMNSVATLVSVDFYERIARNVTPAQSVRLAEYLTVVAGLVGIGTALLLASADIKSALDTSLELGGLLGGGFAGCYVLGLFTKRANWQGVFVGVGASIVLTFLAWKARLVHPYYYPALAVLSCCVVGYAASWFFPAPSQSLLGLTIYTPRREPLVTSALKQSA
ncbi:MAG: sodium:solute symporter [Opitutales bacterium]